MLFQIIIFAIMINLMRLYHSEELENHKIELVFFGIFYLLLEGMQIAKHVYYWVQSNDDINTEQLPIFSF